MRVILRVVSGPARGRSFHFDRRDRFVAGRASDCHLCVSGDPQLALHHFRVEIDPPNLLLVDAGSPDGTYLNEGTERVREAPLRHGDRVRAGETVLLVEIDDLDQAATLDAPGAPSRQPGLDQLLGSTLGTAPARRDVRCLRCGVRAEHEAPRDPAEQMAYFCAPCQLELRRAPLAPPGYRIERELGTGAMGCVYLAIDPSGVRRAVKQILPSAAQSEQARRGFLREAAEQARLDHPRIVRFHELVEARPGIFCLVMEYVEGPSADQLLASSPGGLEPPVAVDIALQALEGLAHAHERGVVHRDIKEQNLLCGKDVHGARSVKVADFGLAKSYAQSGASGLTRTGEAGGTIPYMAPEQILDFKRAQPAADLYAMGATLYRLLTGAFPHDFTSWANALFVALEEPIIPLRHRNPRLPARLASAVEQALEKDPAARYANAEAMHRALSDATQRP